MTVVTEAMREGFLVNVDGEEIRAHKIDCSVNGCPRYVVHFVSLNIKNDDYGRVPGLTKYTGKWYGGGYVFQSYSLAEDLKWALDVVAKYNEIRLIATLSKKDREVIKDNLRAYSANFKPIRIVRDNFGKGFSVFQEGDTSYIQYCYDINYLNGWLYGAVQAKCKQLHAIE